MKGLDFNLEARSAGNINAIKHLVKRVRQKSSDSEVQLLCDAAMAMRAEIEDYRRQEGARLAKERDKLFWKWAEEEGMAPKPEPTQPTLSELEEAWYWRRAW